MSLDRSEKLPTNICMTYLKFMTYSTLSPCCENTQSEDTLGNLFKTTAL